MKIQGYSGWVFLCLVLATISATKHETVITLKYVERDFFEARCQEIPLKGGSGPPLTRYEGKPRLSQDMTFQRVTIDGCRPTNGSFYERLTDFKATFTKRLELINIPADSDFSANSFGHLDLDKKELKLTAASGSLNLPPESTDQFQLLESLWLEDVNASPPAPARELVMRHTGATLNLTEALASVIILEITEPKLISFFDAPVGKCMKLRHLTLAEIPGEQLPEGFLASCSQLEILNLQALHMNSISTGFLRGASRLTHLKISGLHLTTIPADLFQYSPLIRNVDLSDNQLESLPSGLFSKLKKLDNLTLSHNHLRASDLLTVANCTQLRSLTVSDNPLGDLCEDDHSLLMPFRPAPSLLSNLQSLSYLYLARTNVTRVCADWLRDMRELRRLDLSHNAVRSLSCAQLRVARTRGSDRSTLWENECAVDLTGNPVTSVVCSKEDYEKAESDISGDFEAVTLSLDSRLRCDCGAYWAARVLRGRGLRVRFEPRCANGTGIPQDMPLRHAPLSALACPIGACAGHCSCELAPHAGGVRARCYGRDLPVGQLARLAEQQGSELVELRANNAGITVIPADMPLSLKYLDLSNNAISRGSTDAAAALFTGGRRVRLAGNPLVCNCSNLPLLDVLRAYRHLVPEYDNMTCPDGQPLEPVTDALMCYSTATSPTASPLWIAGLVVLVLLALAVATLARPETRLRAKALLRAWGVRKRRGTEDELAFDIFVSHAADDERFVAEQLVPRLEPAYKLCLSYRSWPAGAWLPAQIDASVRAARRALCVVSARAQDTRWARAELRAAHAHAMHGGKDRLVLLLLDVTASELRADDEMRAILKSHAHVRWGERCFWEKLFYALPEPRQQHSTAPNKY